MKDLSLHILDIVQNSVVALATSIQITIEKNLQKDFITLTISDNGKGMDKAFLERVTDPFTTTRTTRKVGLGIPLLKLNAERTGGNLAIQSELGKGTIIKATLIPSNIDCLPMGDVAGTISLLMCSNPTINIEFTYMEDKKEYSICTRDIQESLEDVSIDNAAVYPLVKELIQSNLEELQIRNLG